MHQSADACSALGDSDLLMALMTVCQLADLVLSCQEEKITVTDIVVVGDASDGASGVSEAEAHRPAVVLMDVRMPEMDGIEACRAIRESLPDTRVVMLTSYTDDDAVMSSIMAGACGYLLKNTGKAELVEAVRRASRGESLLDPAITTPIMSRLRELSAKEEDREVALLSDREREILGLVARGLTNRQIAEALIISPNTVRNHVSRILEKLDMSRRSEAASFATRHGLVDEEDAERTEV